MPPNSKKLTGHIGFGMCVRPSGRSCMLGFWTFIYGFPLKKIFDTHLFFLSQLSPFLELCPFEKSEWNVMHAISYEPCMLGFWNFIYGFLMEKCKWVAHPQWFKIVDRFYALHSSIFPQKNLHMFVITWTPCDDSDHPGYPPSLIGVFVVRMKKHWVLSYPMRTAKTLIRLGGCLGWSDSLLGADVILLVSSSCETLLGDRILARG